MPHGANAAPPGQSDVPEITIVSRPTGLAPESLTDFTFLPSGDLLVAGRDGVAARVNDAGQRTTLGTLDVVTTTNRGLSSITLAPHFERSGHLYTLATYDEGRFLMGRVERWAVDDPAAPRTMQRDRVVLDDIPVDGPGHHTVGEIRFDPDGALLVSLGDEGHPGRPDRRNFRALDPAYPGGKILRITPKGDGVPGNPFYDKAAPDSWPSRVYALGMRNPFRFAVRPSTGALYVGDVGALGRRRSPSSGRAPTSDGRASRAGSRSTSRSVTPVASAWQRRPPRCGRTSGRSRPTVSSTPRSSWCLPRSRLTVRGKARLRRLLAGQRVRAGGRR